MSQEIVQQTASLGSLTEADINTLYQAGIIPRDTPKSQILIFANVCKEKELSPFSKEIHLVGYGGRYSVIVGIDGFRKQAAKTGFHAGTDDCKFDLQSDGSYKTAADLKVANQLPVTATVTIYKLVENKIVPFTHTAVFREFSTGKQKWATMPFQMIAKVAESFALRKGFPAQLSGLSIHEEQGAYQDAQVIQSNTSRRHTKIFKTPQAQHPDFQDAITRVREALSYYEGDDKQDYKDDLNQKREEGNLTVEYLNQIIKQLTQ